MKYIKFIFFFFYLIQNETIAKENIMILKLKDGEVKIENFNPGSAVIFPSFTNHKVEKITSGSRATLALWMDGPKFR